MEQQVSITWRLPYRFEQEGDWILAYCPVLDLYAQGRSNDKALENLNTTIQLFLESCYERNTLDEALKECGFRLAKHTKKTVVEENDQKYIDVLLPFNIPHHAKKCPA